MVPAMGANISRDCLSKLSLRPKLRHHHDSVSGSMTLVWINNDRAVIYRPISSLFGKIHLEFSTNRSKGESNGMSGAKWTNFLTIILKKQIHPTAAPKKFSTRPAQQAGTIALGGLLYLTSMSKGRAEDRVDYRYEDYSEDGGRIHIRTQGAYFDAAIKPWLSLKGNFIYDGISGATPTGAPPLPGQTVVPKVTISDIRRAGYVEAAIKFDNHTLSPQIAYSKESDYKSVGLSLNDAIELNDKNTTLLWGVSQSMDQVLPNEGEKLPPDDYLTVPQDKTSSDLLLGVTQLLGPSTVFSANLTLGYSQGFLNDPYKRVFFIADGTVYSQPGQPYTVFPEKRPGHKFRQVAYFSLQHFFDKADGGVEATYRFSHDDFGIIANTVSVQWNQKIGKYVTLSPLLRYYNQTEANFYATKFSGDPLDPVNFPVPTYYSSDYRLSSLNSFTYGVSLSVKIHQHATIDLSYKRYTMSGTDGVTSQDQYPKANVLGGGLTIWF